MTITPTDADFHQAVGARPTGVGLVGWAVGYDETWARDIGYGVPSICDHPGCGGKIDRGLSHVCGSEPHGGDHGCGLYFCMRHMVGYASDRRPVQLCIRCQRSRKPFRPTPDTPEWIHHKATDPSWAEWRAEHPEFKP